MSQIDEIKQWIQAEVLPNIVKVRKPKQNSKTNQILRKNDNESLRVMDMVIHPIGREDVYMLTNCYKVKVVYVFEKAEDTCFFIVKKTLQVSTENYDAMNFETLFQNEIVAYTKIIPTLLQLAKPGTEELAFPKYYYSSLTANAASIVFEDFESDGWRMSKNRVNLSLDHIILAVEQIGIFHGLCYALKAIERDNFDALIGLVKEARYARTPPPQWELCFDAGLKRLRRAVDKFCPQTPSHFLNKLEKLLSHSFIYSKRRVQPIEPYATLCHGDFLRNNIAFKYNNNDPDVPSSAMMFDFQTLRYSSPMVDVCVLLSLSSGKDVRPLHFNEIFDAYHRKLTSTFANHTEMEIPEFLSKPKLLKEYVQYLPYGLGIASFFLSSLYEPMSISPEEMVATDSNDDMLVQDIMNRGGDEVDAEIAALAHELHDLIMREDVDIFENFI